MDELIEFVLSYREKGEEIRRFREKFGLSQSALASLLGESVLSISRIESGRTTAPAWLVLALVELVLCSPDSLAEYSTRPGLGLLAKLGPPGFWRNRAAAFLWSLQNPGVREDRDPSDAADVYVFDDKELAKFREIQASRRSR